MLVRQRGSRQNRSGTWAEERYPLPASGDLMKFRAIIEPDEDGIFVATVPSLPGCVSQGSTRAEAVRNISEAVAGYLESLRERDEPIPPSINEKVIDIAV
jgi:predicted RNase H-like HicB family nuclease